jgi:TRAP-type C4-dicarboxylate transport system substrate-binding protein
VTNLDALQTLFALRRRRLGGVESSTHPIEDNDYQTVRADLAANVALFPKAETIVISRRLFDSLTSHDQQAFRMAAAATVEHANPESQEREDIRHPWELGLKIVPATLADLAPLRRASSPVYRVLERHPLTKPTIARRSRSSSGN